MSAVTASSRHLTASMVVLDPSTGSVLLVHHNASNLWVFPGGHVDGGETPAEAAVREVFEETGVRATIVSDLIVPWRVEEFAAPAKPDRPGKPAEPAHTHIDWLFVGVADPRARVTALVSEVSLAGWVRVADLPSVDVRAEVPSVAQAALDFLTSSPTSRGSTT